jgi:hypothetical protein
MHMSIFNWNQSVPSRSNNMPHTRQCWSLNHKPSHKILGLLCAELHDYKQKCHRLRRHKTGIRIRLWRAFIGRRRHFFSEWWWHYWHKIHRVDWQYKKLHRVDWQYKKLHRVDWQYKLLIYCTCSPQIYRGSQCVTTKTATPNQLRPFLP